MGVKKIRNEETKNQMNKKGFTLIELLVVISIIGLLASVVLIALNSSKAKARDAKRVADMNQTAKAMEMFFNDAFAYPTGTGAIGSATSYVVVGGRILGSTIMQAYKSGTSAINYFTPTYLVTIPISPDPSETGCTVANNKYMYETNDIGSTYTITFCIGTKVGGVLDPGVRYLTPGGFR